jgi:F0F1-type ATP synthase assembly protein I
VDPRERSKIYNGASNGFSRAVEMVVTPLIFGFLGHRVDAWVGTTPLFTVVLAVFCLGYITWKTCAGYQADMERHEAELRASRSRPTPRLATNE